MVNEHYDLLKWQFESIVDL